MCIDNLYVTKSYIDSDVWIDDRPAKDTIVVVCGDDKPVPTGLLDADGNELFHVTTRNQIGFHAKWEQ